MRLLAIDARLTFLPAHVKDRSPAGGGVPIGALPRAAPATPPTRSQPIGAALGAAERTIDEAAARLAAARAAAPRPRSRS
jgi:hypothetical protein